MVSFILTVSFAGRHHYSHFTEEETEAQKGEKGMKIPSKDRANVLVGSLCSKSKLGGHPDSRPDLKPDLNSLSPSSLSPCFAH